MPVSFVPSPQELLRFSPEILLTLAATALMLAEAVMRPGSRTRLAALAFISLAAAIGLSAVAASDPGPAFSNLLVVDDFSTFFRVLVCAAGMLVVLISSNYLKREGHESGEYYALVLFSVAGQCLMASANELIMLFIGLECSSIATYVLAGYLRDDRRNNEAALKYFLLGSFAAAFFLYGIAWLWGAAGTTYLSEIRRLLLDPQSGLNATVVSAAAALLLVGLAFKVSAAPFQMWAPDVYQGAPAPVAAFLSVGPKAAAFAMFLRILMTIFVPFRDKWEPVLWAVALATMVIGNFAALWQTNVKRLLAYSSIAHAGYVTVALTAMSDAGAAAAMFYLAAYALMNIGAFAVVTHVAGQGERHVELADLAGLSRRSPAMAAILSIFLLSLTGVPLTAGFFGKFYIFKAALDSNLVWLAILGLLNSAVAAYYYLRIIVVMYMQEPSQGLPELPAAAPGIRWALVASVAGTFVLGVAPSLVLDYAVASAPLLR
ncbi:MAG: NADH-quinone oxidoreductase subunit N [Bryobacteraceae bacterium]